MPRNVEIKARTDNPTRLRQLALALADSGPELIRQRDTFYNVPRGRLKLREFADGSGELIAYERPDRDGPKTSHYAISPTADPGSLHKALDMALGVRGVVAKERTLILCGRTRIHLDDVAGLGHFVELEVVLGDGESEALGRAEADALMVRLEIAATDLVEGAYLDHLAGRAGDGTA